MNDLLEKKRKELNCYDEIHLLVDNYEDGIINLELFNQQKYKVLWIMKETNGKFNIVSCFKNYKKYKKGVWKTWKNVERISSYILNGLENRSSKIDALHKIAILNLKKTPGCSSTKMKNFSEYYKSSENAKIRKIIQEQIKNIKPDIVICGNVLQLLNKQLNYKNSKCIEKLENMKNKNMYCFNNVLFINAYHPCYPIRSKYISSDQYCKSVENAFNNWLEIKELRILTNFNFESI